MVNIKSEEHTIRTFNIFPKPTHFIVNGFSEPLVGDHNDVLPSNAEKKGYITLNIYVDAAMISCYNEILCICNTVSTYVVPGPVDRYYIDDQIKPLIGYSKQQCNRIYKEKVVGTYLDRTEIFTQPAE